MSNSIFYALVSFVVPALVLFILTGGLSLPRKHENSKIDFESGRSNGLEKAKSEVAFRKEPAQSA